MAKTKPFKVEMWKGFTFKGSRKFDTREEAFKFVASFTDTHNEQWTTQVWGPGVEGSTWNGSSLY
jgi:hypothetical protein